MQASQTGGVEQRPLIVVAERNEAITEGPRLMDFAVACYRLRWPFVLVWVVSIVSSMFWMPLNEKDRFTWTLVVHMADPVTLVGLGAQSPSVSQVVQSPPVSQGLQPLMTEWLAVLAVTGGSSVELNYLKFGSGTKAELLRAGIVATVTSDSDQQSPKALEQLRSAAQAWCEQQSVQWKQLQQDTIATVRKNRDAILAGASSGSRSTELAAAELALAQAEAASHFPPQYDIAPAQASRVSSNFRMDLAHRALSCAAVAAAVVLSLVGWARLRRAAASAA